ncbi:gamma-tubulin complex component 5 [Periplaneta americana]|uniref:gamma-tubulin complex component 5 n=1 Tax=Periplaneta americana TaxID=6978 RepID=UPI0037E8A6F0
MAGRAKETIIPEVRNLITLLTNFHEGEENFKLCERYALSNLWHHRFLSVDSHAVRRSMDGMITKFEVHGHLDTSRKLKELVSVFLNNDIFHDHPQYDIEWSLLSLLLHLSINPTTTAHHLKTVSKPLEVTDEEDDFDWVAYLREGDDKFSFSYDDSSSEEFSSDFDESVDEESDTFATQTVTSSSSLTSEIDFKKKNKEAFIQNLKDIYISEKWLENSVQEPWWTHEKIECNTLSRFPSANVARLWHHHTTRQSPELMLDTPHINTLSEYKVIREILWTLYTPASTYIFKEENGIFVVRPDLTVPSVTKDTFAECLNDICHYFTILKEFQSFGEHLDRSRRDPSYTKLPPNTYEAYWSAIKDFISDFNDLIIEIETKVKKQETTYTLLHLFSDLEPKFSELLYVYEIHIRAVYDWKTSPNWLSASCLLSVIYEQLTHASSNKQSATLLKLFLTSFQVYLDIFDTWLTEGQLQDSREEFVIARSKDKLQKPDEEFIIQPYESELLNGGVKPLPVLQVIVNKALHAGRSIELLRRLDRLSELGKRSDEQGHLYEELITLIEHDLSKFASDTENESLVKTNDDDIITHCDMENGDNFMSEVKDHLLRVGDPFLVKGFESYLNLNQGNQTSQQCNEDMGNNLKRKKQICIKLMQHFKNKILPVKPVLEINLLNLVEEKWKAVCCMVKPIFQNEFNLPLHFQMIRGVFLMECDDIMQQFYSSLFTQVQACEANSFSLTIHLESCLDQRYPDFSSRFSVVVNKKIQYATTVQDAINSIKLRYAVEWPITLILNERNMEYYNAVFQFLLKIKWALFSLQKLRFSDLDQRENKSVPLRKKEKERMQRLQYLRFWLLHSVNSVHSYLMGQVLHLLHLELERNLEEAQELDAVIKAHDSYVQTVYAHCLQSEGCEIIKQSTLQMVWTALRLCEAWATGAIFVSDARLQELEELYAKHHVFLAVTLSNCVENDTRSHLEGLCAVFHPIRLPERFLSYLNQR